jgi:RNA polymerase sigma factor (sigma-70 family)
MDQADLRPHWTDLFEQLIWDEVADRIAVLAPPLLSRLDAAGLRPAAVLRDLSDESLALAVQKDFLRKEAFEELLVNRYTPYLARWFYRWNTGVDQARDLMQQLFVRFLTTRLASFQPTRSFRAYLWQAARNLRVDAVRRRKKERCLDGQAEPHANGAGPVHEAEAHELEERFEEAQRRLPAAEREVLRQAMNGKTADETADALGLPKPRVFALLFRARRQIEQELGLAGRARPSDRRRLTSSEVRDDE